jgi:glycine cleavage system H lipoate-binding protein
MTYLPAESKYSKEHLWIKFSEEKLYVGFTNHFLKAVGKIDVIDVREGLSFKKGEACGIIYGRNKSKKMIMPVSGVILSVNLNSFIDPSIYNYEPYRHWVVIIDVTNHEELEDLFSLVRYEELITSVQSNDI